MRRELPRIPLKGPLRRACSTSAISLVLLGAQAGIATEIPELDRALASYTRVEEAALAPHRAAVEELDAKYLAALDRAFAEAQSAGDLEEALAIRAEREALIEGKIPDAAAKEDLPPSLERLRPTYEEALARLTAERARRIQPLRQEFLETLDALIANLTRESRLDDALAARAKRAELEQEITEQLEAAALDKGIAGLLSGTAEAAKPGEISLAGKTLHFPHHRDSDFTARLAFKEDGKVNWIGLGNAKVEWVYEQADDPLVYKAWMPGRQSTPITATVEPDGRKAVVNYFDGTTVEAEIRRSDRSEAEAP